jgi:iron complex outermembrane recepter protein
MITKSTGALRASVGAVLVAALAMHSGAANAETSDDRTEASGQAAKPDYSLEEIIVTANKYEEPINKVGLTIKALGGAQIEQQHIVSLQDLAAAVPGLNYAQTENGTPVYTLRGIGFYDSTIGAAPAVSIYLDQAPLAYPVMTTLTLFDIERVEVLKGPQGTLFGSNATGGAINYIAAKPTQDPHEGLSLTYGRFNTFNTEGYVSGPITDNLLARIAVNATSGDGWQYSITRPDQTTAAPEALAARFLLDWRPTDHLRIQTNLNGWRDRTQPTQAQFVQFIPNYPGTGIVDIPNASNNPRAVDWSPDTTPSADNRLLQATLRGDYDMTDSIALTSITAYADYKQVMTPDGDGLAKQRQDLRDFDGFVHSLTQEVRIANNTSRIFRWTVGGNYARNVNFDIYNDWYRDGTAAPTFGWFSNGSSVRQIAKDYAGFASGEYTIGQFTLKGGARYTESDRSAINCLFGLNDDGQVNNPLNAAFGVTTPGTCLTLGPDFKPHAVPGKLDQHNVSWRGGIDWNATDDILVYVNASKGFKAGSFGNFGGAVDRSYQPVTQESVVTVEGGVKAQLLDHKLSLTAAAFHSDYSDKQIKSKLLDPTFGYLEALLNVPKSRITGFEAEATVRPVTGLSIGGAVTYLDSKITNSTGPDGAQLITLANNQTSSVGNPLPYTSKWTQAANFNYTFAIGTGSDAFLGGQVMHRTKTNASIGNESFLDIRGYTTVDVQAGVDFHDGKYRVMLWGKNVLNEFYITNRINTFDGVAQYPGMPATVGITLAAKF